MTKVGILVGSLRKESFSKKVALNVAEMFSDAYEPVFIEIDQLPFYNEDDDGENPREEYVAFRNKLKEIDAFLFVTPEYNRSVTAVLKNALDIGSRPPAESIWNKKAAAIISQSPGSLGGFGANHHLRQILTPLNMPVVQQPEVYLSNVATLLDEGGKLNNEQTISFLQSFVNTFEDLIQRTS